MFGDYFRFKYLNFVLFLYFVSIIGAVSIREKVKIVIGIVAVAKKDDVVVAVIAMTEAAKEDMKNGIVMNVTEKKYAKGREPVKKNWKKSV